MFIAPASLTRIVLAPKASSFLCISITFHFQEVSSLPVSVRLPPVVFPLPFPTADGLLISTLLPLFAARNHSNFLTLNFLTPGLSLSAFSLAFREVSYPTRLSPSARTDNG